MRNHVSVGRTPNMDKGIKEIASLVNGIVILVRRVDQSLEIKYVEG